MGILTSFTGKCNISCSGGSSEEFVSSYNNSSSIHFRYDNYGFIDEPIETFSDENTISSFQYEEIGPYADLPIGGDEISLDYGPISKIRYATDDYGYISWTNNQAYGSFNTSGSASIIRFIPEYTGSGSLFTFVSKTETVAVSPDNTKVLFDINGKGKESITPAPHIGSGSLFTFISTSESVGSNPPEGITLFKLSGSAVEKNTESYTASGSLFTFISKTESVAVSPDDTKVLFSIDGKGKESITPAPHIGSGLINIDVTSKESISFAPHIGSGSFSIYQKTKITTLDGKDRLISAYERFTQAATTVGSIIVSRINNITIFETGYYGKGRILLVGKGKEAIIPPPHIGSGSLFTFVSKTESSAVSPDDTKVLFSINGSASNIRFIPEYTGSGSLFTFVSKTESSAVSPDDTKVLFSINGKGKESITPAPHIGSGSLFTFISKTETVAVSPDDTKVLFSINGSATNIRFIPKYPGSGSLNVNGNATNIRFIPKYPGSGSLFTFVSKTETVAVSPDDTKVLFSINGTSKESIIPAPHIGSGSFSINQKTRLIGLDGKGQLVGAYTALIKRRSYSGSSEVSINGNAINTKYVPEHTGSGFFNVNGNATNIRYVPEHTGSGSLFTFVSKTESVTVSPDDTKVLFSINGACKESITPTSYIGSGSVNIDGTSEESITPTPYIGSGSLVTFISKTETVVISPDNTKVLFSINGSATNIRFIPEYTGSGSLFGMGGSSNSVFYDYGVSQKAFKIFGSTLESFTRSNYNGVSLTAVEGQSLNRKIDFIPPKKPRLIVI